VPVKTLTAHLRPYALPLRQPLRHARGLTLKRHGTLWCLQVTPDGPAGVGDAAGWEGFGSGASPEQLTQALAQLAEGLAGTCAEPAAAAASLRFMQGLRELLEKATVRREADPVRTVRANRRKDGSNLDCTVRVVGANGVNGADGASPEDLAFRHQLLQQLEQQIDPWLATFQDFAGAGRVPVEVRHAVELSCLDLLAQHCGCSLAALLCRSAGGPAAQVAMHTLVGDAVGAQAAVKAGATLLKLKLGRRTLDDDIGHVTAIAAAVGPAVKLRLDANGAWPLAVALQAAKLLAAFSPQWLEQPVAADAVEALAQVRRLGAVKIAADEAVHSAAGLQAVLAAAAADVVVLKPMFIGGLLRTRSLADVAAAQGVRCCLTHALESAVGRLGCAHLAAAQAAETLATGETPLGCGLGDPIAAAQDVAPGPQLHGAYCSLPSTPGLGLPWRRALAC
jgi:L-alanine-DL-glutamate epimerase-like enolase superfamily enzyme